MKLTNKKSSLAYSLLLLLFISTTAFSKPYKGAEVYSHETVQYGRWEWRMMAATGSGVLSNFFTYKEGSEQSGTFWEEIDVEVFGKDGAHSFQSNIITGNATLQRSEQVHSPGGLGSGYHTYALEWTPNYIAWFVDGVEVRRTTGGQVTQLTSAQSYRFNLWAANIAEWVGAFDPNILPVHQYINWISYSAYNGNGFTFQWRDDFNSFNTNRWGKANWTFAENYADFDPANATVQNGMLVLSLTREGQTGFSGTVPADDGSSDDGGSDPGTDCTGNATTIPAVIQAENYCEMSGIQLENTSDVGGGQNVGWTDAGDWLVYNINVPSSGSYTVDYRVASLNGGGTIQLESQGGGSVYGSISVPSTGGWQNWTTISHTVQLNAGEQTIAIAITSGGYNINWFEISSGGGSTPPPPSQNTTIVQAENYSQMSGVQLENTSDEGGGQNVGWIDAGDWMNYPAITLSTAGTYTIEYRVASPNGGGTIQFEMSGGSTIYGSISVPSTGGWQNWTTISHTVNLPAGTTQFAINAPSGGYNINWWAYTPGIKSAVEENNEQHQAIEVYPNPARNYIHIEGLDGQSTRLEVYDITGKQFISISSNKTAAEINLSELPKGMYMLKVVSQHNEQSIKFIKE